MKMSSSKFLLTKNNRALNNIQREFYEKNGYILVKNLVPHELLDELSQHFTDICDGKLSIPPLPFIIAKDKSLKLRGYKGQYLMNKIQDFLYEEKFFKYASLPAIINIIESIIGPNIVGVHSMLINKPPDADPDFSNHPLHQDLHYFPFRPANSIAACWTAMEKIDEKNGCLFVIPGSHLRGELLKHVYPEGKENTLYHGIRGFENEDKINLVMEKGDTIFFHPLLLHGSGINRTKGFRKAISVHYCDTNAYFIDIKKSINEDYMKELERVTNIDYLKYWKMKSRHIKGDVGTFRNNLPSNL